MSPQVTAALITAAFTILAIVLKDLAIKWLTDRKEQAESSREVFRRYADPLAASLRDLYWRLDEILLSEGRGAYLLSDVHLSNFANYKRLSTAYRVASVLGWIRALRRELSFLRARDDEQIAEINAAFEFLEKALADGDKVEIKRLNELVALWRIALPQNRQMHERIGIAVDQVLKQFLHSKNVLVARELGTADQRALCIEISAIIASVADMQQPSEEIVSETQHRAIQSLSYREAWLYRDWQAGIGDLMVKVAKVGPRSFEVIGYREFEELYLNGSDEEKRWLSRILGLLENLDASGKDTYDARLDQLKSALVATSKLIQIFIKVDPEMKHSLGPVVERTAAVESNL